MINPYVPLEFHSKYSPSEGLSTLQEIIALTERENIPYVSIADTNGFYGLIRFLTLMKESKSKPLISVKIKTSTLNGVAIARNMQGYEHISGCLTTFHITKHLAIEQFLDKKYENDFFFVTSELSILKRKFSATIAAINPLEPNYGSIAFWSRKNGVRAVFHHPIYFLEPTSHKYQKMLRAVFLNKKEGALNENEFAPPEGYYKTNKMLIEQYPQFSYEMRNCNILAERSFFEFPLGKTIFPKFCDDAKSTLRNLCYTNLPLRYNIGGEQPNLILKKDVISRLEKELSIIEEKGFSDYFLVVHDIVKQCIYTCGRGSGAASIVSYLLFITHVDPIAHNLFFERFLNESRQDPPDIDVDFPWDEREKVLQYILTRYNGKEISGHAAMVSNHITYSSRSSIRESAKLFGVPDFAIEEHNHKSVYAYSRDSNSFELAHKIGKVSDQTAAYSTSLEFCEEFSRVTNGRLRFLSLHCGGVVITPKKTSCYVPVELSPNNIPVIQFEKDQTEDAGLVKIDVLGNRSLAVVRDTINLVNEHYQLNIQYQNFNPIDDLQTQQLFASGDTIGVFYTESPAMRQLQKKTGKGEYKYIVIHSSIIRPAANQYINEYIKRLKGKPYQPIVPELGPLLEETYGIMCYQEDITKTAIAVADFSVKEGEELRKVIGNKNKIRRKEQLKKLFIERVTKKHFEKVALALWDMIESFSGYSFCKPHSASYALLSFKSCWLKAHYPAEFLGAVLKNQGGFYTPLAYISEARRMNVEVIMPTINISNYETFGKRGVLYLGFMLIKGVGKDWVESFLTERKNRGMFKDIIDFINRTEVTSAQISLLIDAGVFDKVEERGRPAIHLLAKQTYLQKSSKRNDGGQTFLTIAKAEGRQGAEQISNNYFIDDFSYPQKLQIEKEIFGSIYSIHPMLLYTTKIPSKLPYPLINGTEIKNYGTKRVCIAAILITSKTVLTQSDEPMKFVSFEDEKDIFETVFFPKIYKAYYSMLHYQGAYLLTGRVDIEFDTPILSVENLKIL